MRSPSRRSCLMCWCRLSAAVWGRRWTPTGRSINRDVIAVEEMVLERLHEYGVVGTGRHVGKAFRSPRRGETSARQAPRLIIMGRYILQPEIFQLLERRAGARAERSSSLMR